MANQMQAVHGSGSRPRWRHPRRTTCGCLRDHYPVWSGCSHDPDLIMLAKLKPLLDQYHASGYMCGHDHRQEHIDEGKGPVCVLSGSGFECCYPGTNAHKVPEGAIKMA